VDGRRATFARHGEKLEPGRIYVAPPDHHLLLENDHLELSRGPRENWARPAIDPLFRSAAQSHGPDVIGIVLSGRLNDGTAGLFEIKRHGGIAVVQTPAEAEAPDMPKNALEHVAVDYCLPIKEISRLLVRLADLPSQKRPVTDETDMTEMTEMTDPPPIIEPSAQTCPECGGAMRQRQIGQLVDFRCHIGHRMTAEILAATQLELLENQLSSVLRILNERVALCRDMAEKCLAAGQTRNAEAWELAADEALQRETRAKEMAEIGWAHPEEGLVG
jgi:two-component system chemotaxis response regulator CheB